MNAIALAQTTPRAGDLAANRAQHLEAARARASELVSRFRSGETTRRGATTAVEVTLS